MNNKIREEENTREIQIMPYLNDKRNGTLKKSLEDNKFREMIMNNLQSYQEMMSRYKCAIMEVETKFDVLNEQFSLQYDRNPIESIKSRLKSADSIMNKALKKEIPFTVEAIETNIMDIAGIRVICSFPKDIYELAACLLRQDDITLIQKKDYIKNPKPGGYRSLHLIVEVPIFLRNETRSMKVEVQLRTIAMDFWASLEHKLRYKKKIDPEEMEYLTKELIDCANISAELDSRMETIKNRIVKNDDGRI